MMDKTSNQMRMVRYNLEKSQLKVNSLVAKLEASDKQLAEIYKDIKTTHNMILANRFKEAEVCCSHIEMVLLESNHKSQAELSNRKDGEK